MEAAQLMEWTGKNENTIILGDLNSLPFLKELNPLFAAGFADVFSAAGMKTQGTFPLERNLFLFVKN
jgi:hypothetical protein